MVVILDLFPFPLVDAMSVGLRRRASRSALKKSLLLTPPDHAETYLGNQGQVPM